MLNSYAITCYLAAIAVLSGNQVAEGFSIQRPMTQARIPLSMWMDEQSFSTPTGVGNMAKIQSLEGQAKACLSSSCDVEHMSMLVQELEQLQNDCTEEGNQTNDECDVALKAEREALIHALEDKITNTVASTMVMFMSTSPKLEDQVKACLDGEVVFTTKQMKSLLRELETLNNDCTEEGHQTDDECDVSIKAERDALAKKLQRKINTPDMMQIKNCLDTGKCSLGELTHMLASLEKENDLCTEEGNQTNDECDITVKADREEMMELLSEQITRKQGESAKKTKMCMQYKLCNTSALSKTLEDLEELTSMCTEEGNQTRSFCSIEAKAERDELMESLRHELELAENVVSSKQKTGGVSVFQI